MNGICSFSRAPLRFCIVTGFILAMLSISAGIIQIIAYFLVEHTKIPGWASLMAGVSFLGGLQLFFLGVLGETAEGRFFIRGQFCVSAAKPS
jgi:dolichol-phosphate mannosyltransferase